MPDHGFQMAELEAKISAKGPGSFGVTVQSPDADSDFHASG